MKNKYIKRAKISEKKFREILKFFAEDLTVSKISNLSNISRYNINSLIQKMRRRIYELSVNSNPFFIGEIEADESYFGASRVRGKRGAWSKWENNGIWLIRKKRQSLYTNSR